MRVISLDELTGVMSHQRVIELTDDYGTGQVDQEALDAAEGSAIADLELYASKHYTLPLPSVPAVKELVRQLTKCHLFFRRGSIPEDVQKMYDGLMKKLKELNPSSLGLPGIEPDASGTDSGAGISVSAPDRRFGPNFAGVDY